ncbi:intermembrane phospholipid transport protein YdbH family protein [Desulforhopalus singaporensis]|nr:YdbH domain-containing protein [Desulforhopalus singaporensis]
MNKRSTNLIWLIGSLALAAVCLYLLLPLLCEKYVLPQLTRSLPFSIRTITLSTLSPTTISGTVELHQQDREVLSLPRFELNYTLSSLKNREIDSLLLESVTLNLETDGDTIYLTPPPAVSHQRDGHSGISLSAWPLAVRTVKIKNGVIILHSKDGGAENAITLLLNGSAALDFATMADGSKVLRSISATVQTGGNTALTARLEANSNEGGENIDIAATIPNLAQLLPRRGAAGNVDTEGSLDLTLNLRLHNFRQLVSFQLSALLDNFRLSSHGTSITQQSPENPVTIRLTGDSKKIDYSLTNLALATVRQIDLASDGTITVQDQTTAAAGSVTVTVNEEVVPTFAADYTATIDRKGSSIDLAVTTGPMTVGNRFSSGPVTVHTFLDMNQTGVRGRIEGSTPALTELQRDLRASGVAFTFPFQFPPPSAKSPPRAGTVTVDNLSLGNTSLATFSSTLTQLSGEPGIGFQSTLTSDFDNRMTVNCNGEALLNFPLKLSCTLPATPFDSSLLPPPLLPPGIPRITGTIEAAVDAEHDTSALRAEATVSFYGGTVIKGDTVLSGIDVKVSFPDLPKFRSAPGQICTIGNISSGTIDMGGAIFSFRTEDANSLFIEKGQVSWCGGKVELGSLLLTRDMDRLSTTLYCDRLGFTDLLSQFGVEETEGEGALNGKIPISWGKEGLVFDDGFLFSTPGDGGIVKFGNTRQLQQGMAGMNQSAYLDYSLMALENFAYNWTRLKLNTIDDNLLLTMELDGKPAAPLPFGYNKGRIVASSRGPGIQHPIRLDVNFTVPLRDLFRYGKNFQSLMENM